MGEDFKYIGWVPTLTGKLLFRHWECSSNLSKKFHRDISINKTDGDSGSLIRNVILSSVVNLRDRQKKGYGTFRIILQASMSLGSSNVSGQIYLYPKDYTNFLSKEKKDSLKKIDVLIKSTYERFKQGETINSDYNLIQQKLFGNSVKGVVLVDFSIDQYGFAKIGLNKIEGLENVDDLTELALCRQAFYFLKYSLHVHQHHEESDDSLTQIHLASNPDVGMKMIGELKIGLVDLKRSFSSANLHGLFGAKGIVSYIKSLAESCLITKKIDENEYKHEMMYLNNTSESLETIVESEERVIEKKQLASSRFISKIAFALAAMAPIVILYKEKILKIIDSRVENYYPNFETVVNVLAYTYSSLRVYALVCVAIILWHFCLKNRVAFSAKWILNFNTVLVTKVKDLNKNLSFNTIRITIPIFVCIVMYIIFRLLA